jgi:nitrite reductase (NO-forming)
MKTILYTVFAFTATWALQACGGGNNAANSPVTTSMDKPAKVSGEEVYKRTCANCHQLDGKGIAKTFPPLAQSDFLLQKQNAIIQVVKGKNGDLVVNGQHYNNIMPPQILSDEEVAAVLTYVYSQWGNTPQTVGADEVKAARAQK